MRTLFNTQMNPSKAKPYYWLQLKKKNNQNI